MVDPDVVKEAENAIREAYSEECHVAADAVLTRVRSGDVVSDEALWDAILDTHRIRAEGNSVTPAWTPLLFSRHRFETPSRPWNPGKDADVLWTLNRTAWIADVCHVLNEHHGMTVRGLSRELFLSGNPLDSLTGEDITAQRIIEDLRAITADIEHEGLRSKITRQVERLERLHRPSSPSLLDSRQR